MENHKKLEQLIEESTIDNSWKIDFQSQLENEESEDFYFELSLRIIERLDEIGWKKSKLAEELGVSKQYISKILRTIQNPSITTIFKIQKVLNFKLIEIAGSNPIKQEKLLLTIKLPTQTQMFERSYSSSGIIVDKNSYPNHKLYNSKWLKGEKQQSNCRC